MALITVNEYLEKYFSEESRPSKRTVWGWLRSGALPAEKFGKQYYLDTGMLKKRHTGNPLADKIINQEKK